MANTKSALKNARKARVRHQRNQAVASRLKTLSKKVRSLQEAGKADEARSAATEFMSVADKAAKVGVIHANAAARKKSQVSGLVFKAAK